MFTFLDSTSVLMKIYAPWKERIQLRPSEEKQISDDFRNSKDPMFLNLFLKRFHEWFHLDMIWKWIIM